MRRWDKKTVHNDINCISEIRTLKRHIDRVSLLSFCSNALINLNEMECANVFEFVKAFICETCNLNIDLDIMVQIFRFHISII